MLPSRETLRDRLDAYTPIITPKMLCLTTVLIVSLCTGTALMHQALIPALTGLTGYAALGIAIPLFVAHVQGLVFVYVAARDRRRVRQLCLAIIFLGAVGAYLIFLSDWWRSLQQHIELLGLLRANDLTPWLETGDVLRQKFLPHILFALLKDVLLSAFIECALLEALRSRRSSHF